MENSPSCGFPLPGCSWLEPAGALLTARMNPPGNLFHRSHRWERSGLPEVSFCFHQLPPPPPPTPPAQGPGEGGVCAHSFPDFPS